MIDRSRRRLIAALGGTIGGTLLAQSAVDRVNSTRRSVVDQGPTTSTPVPVDVDPASLMLETTGREMTAASGSIAHDLMAVDGWETLSGNLTTPPTEPTAEPAIQLSPGSRIAYSFDTPFDFTQSDLSLWVRFPTGPASPVRIRLFAPDEQNQLIAYKYPLNQLPDTRFGIEVGPTDERGSPDPTNVRRIELEAIPGESPVVVDTIKTKPKTSTGRVMLIFDDNRASVATAYEELHQRGMAAATAVIPDLVGKEGHLDAEQLARHHADGWDLLAHPQLENPLPDYSVDRQREEIIRTKKWLVDRGYNDGANHFVAPFGRVEPETLEILSQYHYTNYLTNNLLSGTPPSDPLTIERVSIDDPEYAKAQIQLAARLNMLVVLSVHTVGNDRDTHISREAFVDIVDFIDQSDIVVTTPTEYWQRIQDEP